MRYDPEIARLEDELRESRFTAWDAETFLIERHEAKIAELRKTQSRWREVLVCAKEMADYVCMMLGRLTIVALFGAWLISGLALTY